MCVVIVFKAFVIWVGILILAVINGFIRESVLLPKLGMPAALLLSGLLLSVLIIGVAYISLPWLKIRRRAHLWFAGLGWLVLTLVFEFSFGWWQGKSWSELLDAYTFESGNLWPVVLATTVLAPYVASKLRG